MRVSICVGEYAKKPYNVPGLQINAWCLEELCFLMRENAFLLDQTLMSDALLDWMERECGRRDLARALYPLVHRKGSLSAFVGMILKDVGFYDDATIAEIEVLLKKSSGLSRIEKRKSQVDYLVEKRKYLAALKGYDDLLKNWKEESENAQNPPAQETLMSIWHNKGVAYIGMMFYDAAADAFHTAYELGGGEESFRSYLAAKRLQMDQKEYVAFAADVANGYTTALELEKDLEQANAAWEQEPMYFQLNELCEMRGNNRGRYEEESNALVQRLKENYRSSVEI